MKVYFEKHVVVSFFWTVIVLIFLAWFSFYKMEEVLQTSEWISHSAQVNNNAEQLIKNCIDVETGLRGYMLTHNRDFLEPYTNGRKAIPIHLNTLDSLTAQDTSHRKRMYILRALIEKQLSWVDRVVRINDSSSNIARNMIADGEGKRRTDTLRSLIILIQNQERASFEKGNTLTSKSLLQSQASFLGLIISVTGIIIYLFYALNKSLGMCHLVERKLKMAVHETQVLYNDAPCGYLSVNAAIYLSNINNTLLKWLGYTKAEVIGKMKYEDLLSPESREKFLNSFQEDFDKYKSEGYVSDLEFNFLRKDGTIFPVVVSSIAVFNKENEFVTSRTTVFDNSVRNRIQEKFRGLLEASPDASLVISESGTIKMVNNQCQHVFGYTRQELVEQKLEVLVPERYRQNLPEHQRKYLTNPTICTVGIGLELFGVRKNGEEFPIEISLSPIQTFDGLLISASVRDITERKISENTIKKLNHELEAFTYSVSHDLRAPLRSVAGYSQILKEDYSNKLDDEGQRITEVIVKNAKRMGQLIDDMLDFARMGRKELMKSSVDMEELINDTLCEVVKENGRKINIKRFPLLPVCADLSMLRHVWTNLISNALKYSSKNELTEIEIGSSRENIKNCYYVRDNGVGFDMQYSDKLFGVFQRLHKMNEFEGSGVGLALVKSIIDRHGGEVWAEGKVNAGATFYFTLPNTNYENKINEKQNV